MRRSLIVIAAGAGLMGLVALSPAPAVRAPSPPAGAVATFAGGCFWSMQKAFDGVAGVVGVTAGYAGGSTKNPSYENVETGETGHAESVSIIFYHDAEQRRLAEASKRALDQSHRFPTPIVTAIQPATPFYPAEEYHQQFYKKNPARYEAYRIGCRRDARLEQLWGDLAISQEAAK